MRLRLEPVDEYLHELGPEPNFNESMYFNVYDPTAQLGAFVRLGNRANEGRGEMTTCIYLPDGRVAFMFRRPEIHSNDAFDAAGMRFEVVEPFEHLTVTYDGPVIVLDDPMVMADPRKAFTEHTPVDCAIRLDYRRVSDPYGGEPEQAHEPSGEEFARGHYEQLGAATGTISVDGVETAIAGYGLRDHSWGPRHWQAPWYYRWLTANVGGDFGFMGSRIASRSGSGTRTGFVWDGDQLVLCDDVRISTTWDDTLHHRALEATLSASQPDGGEPRRWHVRGEVLNLIPLRNRREGLMTRISEGLTRWTLDDGRVGYGWSEYLDQIVDDRPVGIDE